MTSPESPKTDFSFFTEPELIQYVAEADVYTIAGLMDDVPQESGVYFFELWRTGRQHELYDALTIVENQKEILSTFYGGRVTSLTAVLNIDHHQPYAVCKSFLFDVYRITEKVKNNFDYHEPMSLDCEAALIDLVDVIVEKVINYKRTRLN